MAAAATGFIRTAGSSSRSSSSDSVNLRNGRVGRKLTRLFRIWPSPSQLRTETSQTSAYATAASRKSRRSLRLRRKDQRGHAGRAGERPVGGDACRSCPASGGVELGRQVGSGAGVDLIRRLAMEGRMGHLRVVLFDVERDQPGLVRGQEGRCARAQAGAAWRQAW
jgi:hypothetical protein